MSREQRVAACISAVMFVATVIALPEPALAVALAWFGGGACAIACGSTREDRA